MPYLPSDAEKKSELYSNLINSNKLELQNRIEDLKKKQQVSGSIDANTPLREDGVLISFESKEAGIALEESFEDVRLQNTQRFYTKKVESNFTFFVPTSESGGDVEVSETEEVDEENVEFQMTNRDFLIQFVNEYFSEEFDPDMSTKLLHSKIIQFFNDVGKLPFGGVVSFIVSQKVNNAEGWEEFRLNKKRKATGISKKRYKKMKKDLANFVYDEVIENHIYRTTEGQRIWLKLGLPYVQDQSPGKDS